MNDQEFKREFDYICAAFFIRSQSIIQLDYPPEGKWAAAWYYVSIKDPTESAFIKVSLKIFIDDAFLWQRHTTSYWSQSWAAGHKAAQAVCTAANGNFVIDLVKKHFQLEPDSGKLALIGDKAGAKARKILDAWIKRPWGQILDSVDEKELTGLVQQMANVTSCDIWRQEAEIKEIVRESKPQPVQLDINDLERSFLEGVRELKKREAKIDRVDLVHTLFAYDGEPFKNMSILNQLDYWWLVGNLAVNSNQDVYDRWLELMKEVTSHRLLFYSRENLAGLNNYLQEPLIDLCAGYAGLVSREEMISRLISLSAIS